MEFASTKIDRKTWQQVTELGSLLEQKTGIPHPNYVVVRMGVHLLAKNTSLEGVMSSENGVPYCQLQAFTQWPFQIGQKVSITTLHKIQGIVLGRADYGSHQRFKVAYCLDGKRQLQWFSPEELLQTVY